MNKKLLSIAIAAAGTVSMGAQAVDFRTGQTTTPIKVASELVISGSGTAINHGTDYNATFATGFGIDSATTRYMRFALSSGTWNNTLADGSLVVGQTTGNATVSKVGGGATTDSYVIYQVSANGSPNTVATSNTAVLTPPNGVKVTGQTDVTISYKLFETALAATNDGDTLAADSGTFIQFTAANSTKADSVTPDDIDVTTTTKTGAIFAGSKDTTVIGAVNTTDATGIANATGTTVGTSNIESASTLTVNGDFTFVQDLDTTTKQPDGTYTLNNVRLDSGSNCNTSTIANAATLTDTKATFTTTGKNPDILYVCVKSNGVSEIAEQTFTGTYASTAASGYSAESTDMTLGTLKKNAKTAQSDLVLTPGGAFKNYIRVTNTSNIAGEVSFTLYADDGASVTGVKLSDISGQSSGSLTGQGSTGLINVTDLYAAAQAKDSTFDHDGGKLRVVATGNFGSIVMQNVTLSTDNTTFATF